MNKIDERLVDVITVRIRCDSEEVEALREEGLFFSAIAGVLGVDRSSVEEVEE